MERIKHIYALTDGQEICKVRAMTDEQREIARHNTAIQTGNIWNWVKLSPMEYIGEDF